MALSGMGQCGAEEDCLHSHHQHQHQQQHQRRALAAAGTTHARGRAHTVRGYLLNTNNPTRAIEDQAAAWLLARRYGWSVFVDRSTYGAFVGTYY